MGSVERARGEVGELPDRHRQVDNLPHRLETCTLLTTEANDLVRPIHDRMPVILPPTAYQSWLDPGIEDPRRLTPLLVLFRATRWRRIRSAAW